VLLVAGTFPPEHLTALDRVHDQLPHPRVVVQWGPSPSPALDARVVDGGAMALVASIVDAQRTLDHERSSTSPDLLADVDPNPWRGVGPHGQGGEGMMGGTPYGRPMAMTGPDRDGLALDRLRLRLGPFLPAIPPGVVLDLTLQGEVVQAASVSEPVSPRRPGGSAFESDVADPARRALRWLAHGLHVHGLDALAVRAARLAVRRSDGDTAPALAADLATLRRQIRRSGLLWTLRGTGVVEGRGDAADRWRSQLDAVGRGLHGDDEGTTARVAWDELALALAGTTLNEAVATIASFDWQEPAGVPA
jgi:hypothetical protein